jgi:hypothetical protein
MIDEWLILNDVEGSGYGLIKVLSRLLPGISEEYHENP